MTPLLVHLVSADHGLVSMIRPALHAHGYRSVVSSDGGAPGRTDDPLPDAVLFDIDDIRELDIIERFRSFSASPIVVLSSDTSDDTKVAAFDRGADEYVTKPVELPELLARLRLSLRRALVSAARGSAKRFQTGDLVVDLLARTVTLGGQPVHLTEREYEVLATLVIHAGSTVSVDDVLKQVWRRPSIDPTRYLVVCIASLQRKLEATPNAPPYVLKVPGGYRIREEKC